MKGPSNAALTHTTYYESVRSCTCGRLLATSSACVPLRRQKTLQLSSLLSADYMDTCVAVRASAWNCLMLRATAANITQQGPRTKQAELDLCVKARARTSVAAVQSQKSPRSITTHTCARTCTDHVDAYLYVRVRNVLRAHTTYTLIKMSPRYIFVLAPLTSTTLSTCMYRCTSHTYVAPVQLKPKKYRVNISINSRKLCNCVSTAVH